MRRVPILSAIFASFVLASLAVGPVAHADDTDTCADAALAGQRARDNGAFTSARASFLECARPVCPNLIRADCTKWAGEVEATMPTIVLGARDAAGQDVRGVRMAIDGKAVDGQDGAKALALDPGTHQVRFEKPSYRPVTMEVVARPGDKNRAVVATMEPEGVAAVSPTPAGGTSDAGRSRFSTPVIALAAVGAVGLASFATFGVLGLSERSSLKDSCANACTDAQVSTLKTRFIVADVSLAVGIVGLGVATALYFTGGKSAAPTSAHFLVDGLRF